MEIALTTYLIAEITDVSSRVYPNWIPRGVLLPAIAVHRRSGDYQHELTGSAGFASPEFQFSVFSNSYATTKDLTEQVRQALQGYTGAMGAETVLSCWHSNEYDFYEPPEDKSEQGIYHTASLYRILHEVAAPSHTPGTGTITNSAIEPALRSYLLSELPTLKLYPLTLPRDVALPAVTYKRSTGGHEHELTGSAGYAMPRYDLVCYGSTYGEVAALRDSIREKLDGLHGVYSGCRIMAITAAQSSDSPAPPKDGSSNWTAAASISFYVLYQESAPSF